ncbi:trace amine-associated receptor 13c-like [Eucyclogobius newberryi]|uniref:trace amine-associated receptor 13c-like n=1 Tax=Eucyclogobius newberryi TaxID=166745 RepID=UPI003B5A5391
MLTSILNLFAIIAITHFRKLHTLTNFMLLSLAVSDFFVGLVVLPVEGVSWKICWTLGDLTCVMFYILTMTLFIASVGNIVLISVDRYVAICQPMHYQRRITKNTVRIGIAVCWFYSFIYSVLFFLEYVKDPGKYKSCEGKCAVHYSIEVDTIFGFVVPFCIIIILYTRVVIVAISQARAMRSHVRALTFKMSKRSEIKAVRNLGIIVLVYLACYCPYYCVGFSGTYITILGTPLVVITYLLIYLNSCLNPLMYILLYPWFRKAFKLIVTLQIMKPGSSDLNII